MTPGSRFQFDGASTVLGYPKFRKHVQSIVGSCLDFWQLYSRKPSHKANRYSAFADLRDYLQSNLAGVGHLKVQHFLMVAAPIGLVPLWLSSLAIVELNGRTFQRLSSAYGFNKSEANQPFAQKLLVATASLIGESAALVDNLLCKYGRDHFRTLKNTVVYQKAKKTSNFSDTVFLEQSFYVPNNLATCITIFCPNGTTTLLEGPLFKRWPLSNAVGGDIVSCEEIYKYVEVGKNITFLNPKFEFARLCLTDKSNRNQSSNLGRNPEYLFEKSYLVSDANWNSLHRKMVIDECDLESDEDEHSGGDDGDQEYGGLHSTNDINDGPVSVIGCPVTIGGLNRCPGRESASPVVLNHMVYNLGENVSRMDSFHVDLDQEEASDSCDLLGNEFHDEFDIDYFPESLPIIPAASKKRLPTQYPCRGKPDTKKFKDNNGVTNNDIFSCLVGDGRLSMLSFPPLRNGNG